MLTIGNFSGEAIDYQEFIVKKQLNIANVLAKTVEIQTFQENSVNYQEFSVLKQLNIWTFLEKPVKFLEFPEKNSFASRIFRENLQGEKNPYNQDSFAAIQGVWSSAYHRILV